MNMHLPRRWPSLATFLLSLLLLLPPAAQAADEKPSEATKTWQDYSQELDKAEKRLSTQPTAAEALETVTADALAANQFALGCISNNEAEQARVQAALDSLGEESPHEDQELQKTRTDLEKQKQEVDKGLSQCRLLGVRAKAIQDQASVNKQNILKERLLAPGTSVFAYTLKALQEPTLWATESKQVILTLLALPINDPNLRLAFLYGVIGMFAGFAWSASRGRQRQQDEAKLAATSPTLATLWISVVSMMPWLLLLGLSSLSFYFNPPGVEAISELMANLLIFIISYLLLRSALRPGARMAGVVPVVPGTSRKLFFWTRLFLLTVLLGVLFFSPLFDTDPPSSLVGLIRLGLGTLSGLSLLRLIWVLRKHLTWLNEFRIYLMVGVLLLGSVVMLWLGYQSFFTFIFSGVFGSLFILLISWFAFRIPTEIFDGLDEGRAPWQQHFRKKLGLEEQKVIPGLIWLRLVLALLVLVGSGLLLLRLWGLSDQSLQVIFTQILNGFKIGNFTLEPIRIVGGLSLLALLISLNHLFKSSLANSWLKRTNLSRGAKEATVTVVGYIGILTSILLGLSAAGIDFSNLALIAGALSVGIGFGLQNIVNNFVSGLILLFERPIRRGDWIKVGTSEGYVREISIRSTIIQTFNRSDIIVPNSELISNQVTNMMLSNQYGRIVIPIRVAYGSDTALVMKVLHQVAEKNPAVLREHGDLKILVLFSSFGDSALNFELRCQIKDVENQLQVTSELNLAIDQAFRESGIEIPFPQRTIHYARPAEEMPQKTAKTEDLG